MKNGTTKMTVRTMRAVLGLADWPFEHISRLNRMANQPNAIVVWQYTGTGLPGGNDHAGEGMMSGTRMAAALGLLAAACTTTNETGVREQLDERTGVTVTSMSAPLEFFSPQPERGPQAASFAYLGPIEINRMGTRQIFLWLSVLLETDERSRSAEVKPDRLRLRIAAAGSTFEPAYVTADARQVGLGHQVYERPARWVGEAFFAITLADVAQMAAASTLTLEIGTNGAEARRYEAWNADLTGLRRFAERIVAESP